MSLDEVVRNTVTEWAAEAGTPRYAAGLADTALRGYAARRRRRRVATVLVAAGVAVAVAVPVALAVTGRSTPPVGHPGPGPSLIRRSPTQQPPHERGTMAGWTPLPLSHAHTGSTSVSAYPGESPPVHLVAADDVALSAYYLSRSQGGQEVYTWSLYDPTSGTYRHTPYQQLDVAPGLGLAAVLERAAGSDRIGILDMATWQVMRWIPVPAGDPVGSVRFSPDGTKLVATVFDGNAATRDASVRGIIVIDLVAGTLGIQPLGHPAPGMGPNVGARWTADGAYIYLHWQDDLTGLGLQFYTPDGTPVPDPPRADVIATIWGGGVSPDGTLYADPNSASPTAVKKLATGRVEGHQPLENIQAWADNRAVIGDYCGPGCHSEFQTHLALTSTDGTAVTVLTGTQTGNDSSPQQWEPVFTRR